MKRIEVHLHEDALPMAKIAVKEYDHEQDKWKKTRLYRCYDPIVLDNSKIVPFFYKKNLAILYKNKAHEDSIARPLRQWKLEYDTDFAAIFKKDELGPSFLITRHNGNKAFASRVLDYNDYGRYVIINTTDATVVIENKKKLAEMRVVNK